MKFNWQKYPIFATIIMEKKMGFFNGILKGLGFEGQKKDNESKQEKIQNDAFEVKSAEFD